VNFAGQRRQIRLPHSKAETLRALPYALCFLSTTEQPTTVFSLTLKNSGLFVFGIKKRPKAFIWHPFCRRFDV
jgi:hypothetical protein